MKLDYDEVIKILSGLGHNPKESFGSSCKDCDFSWTYILSNNLECTPKPAAKEPETVGDPEIIYICPNCKRERHTITIDTLAGLTIGPYVNQRLALGLVTKGIIKVECKCGLKATFDWNNVRRQ